MTCMNQVGVKNITLAFKDCDPNSPGSIGDIKPIAHQMNGEAMPELDPLNYKLEGLSGGYVKRSYQNATIKLDLFRNLAIPLAYYTGRANIDVQIEYVNGAVWTGTGGGVTDPDSSDTSTVSFTLNYASLTEILPPGASLN